MITESKNKRTKVDRANKTNSAEMLLEHLEAVTCPLIPELNYAIAAAANQSLALLNRSMNTIQSPFSSGADQTEFTNLLSFTIAK